MSDFKSLKGLFIKHVSSDPSNLITGEIWYNTTTQTLKIAPELGAWASGGNMTTARGSNSEQFIGTQTAALVGGGFIGPAGSNKTAVTEEYDGSSWTESGDLSTARSNAGGFGIQTAAVVAGGELPPTNESLATEEYNGSSWANGENVPIYKVSASGTGVLTAGLMAGGAGSPDGDPGTSGATAATLEYDGTDWTAGGDVNTVRYRAGVVGTQTAGLKFGGGNPGFTGPTESYDGSSWTALPNSLGTGRAGLGQAGTQTSALGFGGYLPGFSALTEEWDGSSWAAASAIATARTGAASAGTTSSALMAGGANPHTTTAATTEEWTKAGTARSVDTT